MADFLTTRGISHEIEKIIMEAKGKLFLVSPYLQISKTLLERLQDSSSRGVKIKIIYGKDELKQAEKNALAELKNLELFFHENLHAKCYFNESKLIITSMNMYQYSENNNREMGILVDAHKETDLFQKAVNEVASILNHSKPISLRPAARTQENNQYSSSYSNSSHSNNQYTKNKSYPNSHTKQQNRSSYHRGYCVRCKDKIDFDPSRPFCYDCYSTWAEFENPFYIEEHCHCCGSHFPSSMAVPLCDECD